MGEFRRREARQIRRAAKALGTSKEAAERLIRQAKAARTRADGRIIDTRLRRRS
jgi:hypothetical protein